MSSVASTRRRSNCSGTLCSRAATAAAIARCRFCRRHTARHTAPLARGRRCRRLQRPRAEQQSVGRGRSSFTTAATTATRSRRGVLLGVAGSLVCSATAQRLLRPAGGQRPGNDGAGQRGDARRANLRHVLSTPIHNRSIGSMRTTRRASSVDEPCALLRIPWLGGASRAARRSQSQPNSPERRSRVTKMHEPATQQALLRNEPGRSI